MSPHDEVGSPVAAKAAKGRAEAGRQRLSLRWRHGIGQHGIGPCRTAALWPQGVAGAGYAAAARGGPGQLIQMARPPPAAWGPARRSMDTDMQEASFTNACLVNCKFDGSEVQPFKGSDTSFHHACLHGVSFADAHRFEANLRYVGIAKTSGSRPVTSLGHQVRTTAPGRHSCLNSIPAKQRPLARRPIATLTINGGKLWCRLPDAINMRPSLWLHTRSSGEYWHTGATERPFGCGSDGTSAD